MNIERRFQRRSREAAKATGRTITGYAARYNIATDIGGQFIEVIRPSAFSRAIRERQDCRFLVNHNPDHIVARVGNGTLALQEDEKGLQFRCDVASTRSGDDLLELLRTQTLSGCSFGFMVPDGGDRWSSTIDGKGRRRDLRELCDVDLLDCSVVTYPQYSGTDARWLEDADPDSDDEDEEDEQQYGTLAMTAAAGSRSMPMELRSRIEAVINQDEVALRTRAQVLLTRLALSDL